MTRIRKVLTAISIAAVLALGANWVWAHGGDAALIHACVQDSNGHIRIVGPNTECKNSETPLDWSPGGAGTVGQIQLKGYVDAPDRNVCGNPWGTDVAGCGPANQFPVTTGLMIQAMAVQPYDNNTGGSVTLLVNGTPTALTATIPAGSEEVVIMRAEVPVQAGDVLTVRGNCPCVEGLAGFFFNATLEYR